MYADQIRDTIITAPASAEEIAELTGYLRRWSARRQAEGDPRDAATLISEALDLIGMMSIAEPLKRLRELVGGDGAQPRQRDVI